jgi:hypothetical protein
MSHPPYRQPLLHDLFVTLAAPTALLCSPTGDVDAAAPGGGAQGLFHADVRAVSRIRLTVSGEEPEHLRSSPTGPGEFHVVSLARNLGDATPDPTVRLDRVRTVSPGRFTERLSLASTATEPVTAVIRIETQSDQLPLEQVKAGAPGVPVPSRVVDDRRIEWSGHSITVVLSAPAAVLTPEAVEWTLKVSPRQTVSVEWWVEVSGDGEVVGPAPQAPTWSRPRVTADDRRLIRWAEQSLDDAHGLRMSITGHPQDVFLAAGTPWFFTLFGRDSLWAARMLLPLGTDLARGTLRVLARLQGTRDHPASEQEPGKILHELRQATFDDGMGLVLPPVY